MLPGVATGGLVQPTKSHTRKDILDLSRWCEFFRWRSLPKSEMREVLVGKSSEYMQIVAGVSGAFGASSCETHFRGLLRGLVIFDRDAKYGLEVPAAVRKLSAAWDIEVRIRRRSCRNDEKAIGAR